MSPKPKVGMSLYTYGADIRRSRMTVREAIEHAASLGVEGIEFVDNSIYQTTRTPVSTTCGGSETV